MKKKKVVKGLKEIIMSVFIICLIILVVIMLWIVTQMQGQARVINYAGIVRGATQRLVKQELMGNPDDELLERLDRIINGLQTGEGTLNLIKLEDEDYLDRLETLSSAWEDLKDVIVEARVDTSKRNVLYELSEAYFVLADQTVSAAEDYSEGRADILKNIEFIMIANIMVIICLMLYQMTEGIRLAGKNRQLISMAYVDANTGLPNKRSCEEKLEEGGILTEEDQIACLMFDLNNLKLVNDVIGHKAGDMLIADFAKILRSSAPGKMFIGRFGGDEFIGISRDISEEGIIEFLDLLNHNVEEFNKLTQSGRISFAYGYAMSDAYNGSTLKVLMDEADKNMYKKKMEMKAGKNMDYTLKLK